MNSEAIPVPLPDPESQEFWDAARSGRFILQHCSACDTHQFYPRPHCATCGFPDPSWADASGRGSIYSLTVARKAAGAFSSAVPYVVALVDLEEGPRLLARIRTTDTASVTIGQSVRAVLGEAVCENGIEFESDPKAR